MGLSPDAALWAIIVGVAGFLGIVAVVSWGLGQYRVKRLARRNTGAYEHRTGVDV
ncbi:hypothetical protein K505DRAFT_330412 [Melanomma pulvis-pyrius CBS 109.77]|uniref:Uncharacterized protein n=1 Tax=Melanomma pulvis-pyrius CBS 109.77 TaxID=1314802 RepID=A0A6A6WR11_9PLEO|nr:hypothetical protein K505DRAFT_330412 [Melanomma pulvis-pyrius CBS 109.77]